MTTAATADDAGGVGQHREVAAEAVPEGSPVPSEPLVHMLIPMTQPVMGAEMHHQQAETDQHRSNQDHAAHQATDTATAGCRFSSTAWSSIGSLRRPSRGSSRARFGARSSGSG